MKKIKVYLASGWFTPTTLKILDQMEDTLSNNPYVDLYSPRRDGVKLTEGEKHDEKLLESIFSDNLKHIKDADFVFANIESTDSWNDPGTMYEIGYAMSINVPVVGVYKNITGLGSRFRGALTGFTNIIELDDINSYIEKELSLSSRVLYVSNGDTSLDDKIISILNTKGFNVRVVNHNSSDLYNKKDVLFNNEVVDFMIAVVDDRDTIVSWSMGGAYAQGVPIITYSNQNYGLNVMLLASIKTHVRGLEELDDILTFIKKNGLDSIPKFDMSQLESW